VEAAPLDQPPQRLAGREQVRLADELVEICRPHPVGQRSPVGRRGQFLLSHVSNL
jgi:hypothetical protein